MPDMENLPPDEHLDSSTSTSNSTPIKPPLPSAPLPDQALESAQPPVQHTRNERTLASPWQSQGLEAVGDTHVGMVRESNQDSFCIDHRTGVYLVADGMGGRAGGEIASRLAVACVNEEITNGIATLLNQEISARRTILAQAINAASLRIYERSLELPQFRGMGTTCTLLWIPPHSRNPEKLSDVAIVAHVGDSRCYLLRAGLLYQVTEDHSLVNEQIKAGILRKTDPLVAQMRNVITRCVGYQEEEEVDTFAVELFEGDRFLICSDGLTNKVKDLEIAEGLARTSLENVPTDLIALANERGGEDNITVVVVGLS